MKSICSKDIQTKWSELPLQIQIIILQLNKECANDFQKYQYLVDCYKTFFQNPVLRYITEEYDDTKRNYDDILATPYNLSDCYFEEEWQTALNSNTGKKVTVGKKSEYQILSLKR